MMCTQTTNKQIQFRMKATLITLVTILVLLGIVVLGSIGIYNGQISRDEDCIKSWADVEATYQRRADLIPNLVNTVKGYASHEKETLEAVVNARKQVTELTAKLDTGVELDEQSMQKFMNAQEQLSSTLNRLLVTVERYPDLKANQNFLDLQHQLEGTENRINVARQRYNGSVADLNKSVRGFFGKMVSNMSGVNQRKPFKASEGSENSPEVLF